MTPKLHFEEEDQDQEKECLDFQDVEEIPRGRRLIVVRRSRVIAMEEVFEVSSEQTKHIFLRKHKNLIC